MSYRLMTVAALSLLALGCGLIDPVLCTTDAVPALHVQAVDGSTGAAVPEPVIWVRDGVFVDTLEVAGPAFAQGPFERPGTYEVHVVAAGYTDWRRPHVVVDSDECHVKTVEVIAHLTASSP